MKQSNARIGMTQVMYAHVRQARRTSDHIPDSRSVSKMRSLLRAWKHEWIVTLLESLHALGQCKCRRAKFSLTSPSLGVRKSCGAPFPVDLRPLELERFTFAPAGQHEKTNHGDADG